MLEAIPARSADTTPDAERVQVALFRAAPVARRLHVAFSLSATIIGAARRALARLQPHASKRELDLQFVALHYGPDVSECLRADLDRREQRASAWSMTESDLVAALRPVADAFDALGVGYLSRRIDCQFGSRDRSRQSRCRSRRRPGA